MFKVEINKAFYASLDALRIFWAYPEKNEKNYIRFYLKALLMRLCTFLVCCFLSALHFVMTLKENTGEDVSEDISVTIAGTTLVMIGSLFAFSSRKWSKLFSRITDFSKFGKPPNIEETITFTNSRSVKCRYIIAITIFSYFGTACYEAYKCQKINNEKHLNQFCISMLPVWFPFEVTNFYVKVGLMIFQAINVVEASICAFITAYISWETTFIISSHMNHLRIMFEDIFLDKDTTTQRKKFGIWCCYHQHVIETFNDFNRLNKICIGPAAVVVALAIGCIANQMVRQVKVLGAALFLICYMMALFMVCAAGQNIVNQSELLSESIFASKWYEADVSLIKDISFLLFKTQKVLKLESVPLGYFNYELYLVVMKTSYSFLTLLLERA